MQDVGLYFLCLSFYLLYVFSTTTTTPGSYAEQLLLGFLRGSLIFLWLPRHWGRIKIEASKDKEISQDHP